MQLYNPSLHKHPTLQSPVFFTNATSVDVPIVEIGLTALNGCVCICFIFFSNYHSEAQTYGRHFADDIFKRIFVNENL